MAFQVKYRRGWSIKRIILFVSAIVFSVVASYYSDSVQDVIWEKILEVACSALAVLTGFFVTVLSLMGNIDSSILSMSSEEMKTYWVTYTARIERQAYGCILLLISVVLSMSCFVFPDVKILRTFFTFFAVSGIIWSFTFPFTIFALYKEKYEYLIEVKSKNEKKNTKFIIDL